MEASSSWFITKRLYGINFCGAVFTNLSHDHLDYHQTLNNYFDTKKLFTNYLKAGAIVSINLDDEYGIKLFNEIKDKPYSFINFGKNKLANLEF